MEPTEENLRAWEDAHRARAEPVELPVFVQRTLGDLKGKRVLHLLCGTGEATAALAERLLPRPGRSRPAVADGPGRERPRARRTARSGARGVPGWHIAPPPRPTHPGDVPPLRAPHRLAMSGTATSGTWYRTCSTRACPAETFRLDQAVVLVSADTAGTCYRPCLVRTAVRAPRRARRR